MTNICKKDQLGTDVLNMDVVDPSQAVLSIGGEESDEMYVYADINSYIEKYCSLNTKVTYLTSNSAIMLKDDLVFRSKGVEHGKEYIYVGNNKFETMGNSVEINKNKYTLEGASGNYTLTIKAGEYFPVVNGKNTAIILGEEIAIEYAESQNTYVVYMPE